MGSNLTTRANVSSKSIPSSSIYLYATSLALFLITLPNSLDLFLKIHLVLITLDWSSLGTKVHTSFLVNCSNSSCIAFTQYSSNKASLTFFGLDKETKHTYLAKFTYILLVSMVSSSLPIEIYWMIFLDPRWRFLYDFVIQNFLGTTFLTCCLFMCFVCGVDSLSISVAAEK